jgi:predicted transcriptional regulator
MRPKRNQTQSECNHEVEMKNKALTIRVDEDLYSQAVEMANQQQQTLTNFLRQAVQSECNQMRSERNQTQSGRNHEAEIAWYQSQLDQAAIERQRNQDILLANEAIMKSITNLAESQRLQLEEYRQPRRFLERLRAIFVPD